MNELKIPLTKGHFAIVDESDFESLSKFNWHSHKGYAQRNFYSPQKQTTIKMHRQIMRAEDGKQVDHINGNKLDNRKCNLRICTNQQNTFNSSAHKNSTSKLKGVSWYKSGSKWRAQISINQKRTHIGYFKTEQEAFDAYKKLAKQHYGEFSKV